MSPINAFLLKNGLRIAANPCISPDCCLDWASALARLRQGGRLKEFDRSRFATADGEWTLLEDPETGDGVWRLRPQSRSSRPIEALDEGAALPDGSMAFPASFSNLLRLKNLVQEHDAGSTIFPTASDPLGRSTLGVGARFTTLHWPAVEWSMAALGRGMTANQNSIPRELVYDVDAMLEGRLDTVPFPFIGASVPEGHQGQSVEGMSHACVLSKLKSGFHLRRIPWSFNADHQPIGGKFDDREDRLVEGCILASYITFDLSPVLGERSKVSPEASAMGDAPDPAFLSRLESRLAAAGIALARPQIASLLAPVWLALRKMKRRDEKYAAARARLFTTPAGRTYLRELSIDELPGLTAPETTAIMLASCEEMGMRIHFVAPAFGFQKNTPYPDNDALRKLVEKQWAVCSKFDAGIGFHSGSGKSAENYGVMGRVTGGRLEIKTSGRYTYEMGRALSESSDPGDRALWLDWHRFTKELALAGAFSPDETERKMARGFIATALKAERRPADAFESAGACRAVLEELPPSPDHMFWFEYNFLYVLAAEGQPAKTALGDHTPAGFRQRARFYAISAEGRFRYARNVARYLLFLARSTGLCPAAACAAAERKLEGYSSLDQMLADI